MAGAAVGGVAQAEPSKATTINNKLRRNNLVFQEYHIVPITENVREAVEIGIGIDNTLKEIIKKELSADSVALGDEGGFVPEVSDVRKPLFFLNQAIKQNCDEFALNSSLLIHDYIPISEINYKQPLKFKFQEKRISLFSFHHLQYLEM